LDNSAISQNTWKLLDSLKKDQTIDAYIFLGDYGYEFFQNNGTQGDLFLETLEPYATSVPWLMTPGNHEENLNYSFYNDKIHHPNYHYSNNHYYSVNIGLVHFISVDLNFYNDGNNT
jgi:metallophosphoesterase superfamily enzyme